MLKFTLIGALLLLFPPVDFAQFYGSDYRDALSYVRENKAEFLDVAAQVECDPEELSAILFPELIRYSLLRDFFETKALELLYIQNGKGTADFSIGRFQMKPSFVEELEAYLAASKNLKPYFEDMLFYEKEDVVYRRKKRVERLKDERWQMMYAAALLKVSYEKFDPEMPVASPEKIRFLATVYNHGFLDDAATIKRWIPKKYFPYGLRYQGPQHAYADVAGDFFEKYVEELMTP